MTERDHFFFFNDTATTEIYTLSLHDALPICLLVTEVLIHHLDTLRFLLGEMEVVTARLQRSNRDIIAEDVASIVLITREDRKSTRLNSSHANISYAVFCLKKKQIIYRYLPFI